MKNIILLFLVGLFTYGTASATDGSKKTVNTDKSTVSWTGKKVLGMGKHSGTVGIKSGELEFDGSDLVGGSFTIDMTTLTNTDMAGKPGAGKLEGHLKSDDFFGVASHPEATIVLTSVKASKGSYEITADVTIKGMTAPVTFTADVAGNNASADIVIDRTKHNVKYGSGKFFDGLGDKAISDEFTLAVKLFY